ncbi:MAG: DUF983 domain-containing protein [Cyclobacteriaceae bacterium]|nr:DUF983 domain-containing protein [Cyclobacteriaceae bacterium]MDX5465853.1 DUF983 domain-containing protein [Cyclobacteriaceae bacterium]
MSQTTSLIRSIFTCKCPKCRKGNLFVGNELSRPKQLFEMHKSCPVCSQSFEPEPGFYFGAMFISYAFNTALFILVWLIYANLTDDFSIAILLGIMGISAVIFLPLFYRWSRSIWIFIFVPFSRKTQSLESNS